MPLKFTQAHVSMVLTSFAEFPLFHGFIQSSRPFTRLAAPLATMFTSVAQPLQRNRHSPLYNRGSCLCKKIKLQLPKGTATGPTQSASSTILDPQGALTTQFSVVSMGKTDTSKAQNAWTVEQRIALHLLHTKNPNLGNQTIADIFNHIFADELKACGFPSGLKSKVLYSQYRERERAEERSHLWHAAFEILRADKSLEGKLLGRIELAAKAVGAAITAVPPTTDLIYDGSETVGKEPKRKGWKGWTEPMDVDAHRLLQTRKENGFAEEWQSKSRTRRGGASGAPSSVASAPAVLSVIVSETFRQAQVDDKNNHDDDWQTEGGERDEVEQGENCEQAGRGIKDNRDESNEPVMPPSLVHSNFGAVPMDVKLEMLHRYAIIWI